MSAILRLLQEMGFSITFASDSEDYLPNQQNVLKERGIFVLQGRHATQHHLATEGGKYHFVLLSRPETAFHYLPYVRAYALYSKSYTIWLTSIGSDLSEKWRFQATVI